MWITREKIYTETSCGSLKKAMVWNNWLLIQNRENAIAKFPFSISPFVKFQIFSKKFRYKACLFETSIFSLNYERVQESISNLETKKAKEKERKTKIIKLQRPRSNSADHVHNPKGTNKQITSL